MHRNISKWRKEISVSPVTGSDNRKPNRKKWKILKKYRETNAREFAQLTEKIRQKVQAKAQRIRRHEKKENPVHPE
jgi:hypothetical protein